MNIATSLKIDPKKTVLSLALIVGFSGCNSPEDGRPRAGGRGGDGGNYESKPVAVPSKIEGTKSVPRNAG